MINGVYALFLHVLRKVIYQGSVWNTWTICSSIFNKISELKIWTAVCHFKWFTHLARRLGRYIYTVYIAGCSVSFPFGVSRFIYFQSIRNQEAIWLALIMETIGIILTLYHYLNKNLMLTIPLPLSGQVPWLVLCHAMLQVFTPTQVTWCASSKLPCARHGAFSIPCSHHIWPVNNKMLVKKQIIQLLSEKDLACISLCKHGDETD